MDREKRAQRSYNEKEIGALIQRATELHEEARGNAAGGLTLKEIEHIAAELGLPPEYLRKAALELKGRPDPDAKFSLWGRPFVIGQARVVDGTMSEEQWGEIVSELRSSAGGAGHVSEIGKAREWFRSIGEGDGGFNFSKTRVSVRPGDEETSIRIQKHFGGTAVVAYVAAVALGVIAFGFFLSEGFSDLTSLIIGFGLGLSSLALVRTSIALWARRQKDRLRKLADALAGMLSAPSSDTPLIQPTPELEPPELDKPGAVSAPRSRQRN